MALPTWKCENCGKTFTVNEWMCDEAYPHIVKEKEYLLNDAPSDPGMSRDRINEALRHGTTRICNIPPDKLIQNGTETIRIPGGYVEFRQGRFSTNNPEVQYYLDKKGGFCTKEQWDAAWLTPQQQLEQKQLEVEAMKQRLEVERNELLAQTKKRVSA